MLAALAVTLAIVTSKLPNPPITVESCKFVKAASFSRGVKIAYKNTSTRTAKLVVFEIIHGSTMAAVIDEGTFTPGETVSHVLTSAPLTLWLGENPDRCAVVHVHFSDGSTWGR